MNPMTLVEAMAEPGFLMAFGLGIVSAVLSSIHRRGSAWVVSTAGAAIVALLLEDRLRGLALPSVGLVALAALSVGLGVTGAAQISQRYGPGLAFVCLLATALGVWGTVPDTENATVLLGAVAGGSFGAVRVRSSAAIWSWIPIIAIVSAVAVTEGQARASAPIGALAVLGVLMIHPLVDRAAADVPGWLLLAVHVLLVVIGGRVAGTAETAPMAGLLAIVGLAFGAWLLARSPQWVALVSKRTPT